MNPVEVGITPNSAAGFDWFVDFDDPFRSETGSAPTMAEAWLRVGALIHGAEVVVRSADEAAASVVEGVG